MAKLPQIIRFTAEHGFVGALPVYSQNSALAAMTADGKVAAWGAFCPGVLGMARAGDPESLSRLEKVMDSHLKRFAFREPEMAVEWRRGA